MRLKVRVHFSKKVRLVDGNPLHAYLTKPPAHGQANQQLLSLLRKKYGPCKIVSGKTNRNKTIETASHL